MIALGDRAIGVIMSASIVLLGVALIVFARRFTEDYFDGGWWRMVFNREPSRRVYTIGMRLFGAAMITLGTASLLLELTGNR